MRPPTAGGSSDLLGRHVQRPDASGECHHEHRRKREELRTDQVQRIGKDAVVDPREAHDQREGTGPDAQGQPPERVHHVQRRQGQLEEGNGHRHLEEAPGRCRRVGREAVLEEQIATRSGGYADDGTRPKDATGRPRSEGPVALESVEVPAA